MNWKRGFGIGLMFVGIYLIAINGSITGNVVGFDNFEKTDIIGYFGIVVFLVGVLFIFIVKRNNFPIPKGLEDIVEVVGFENSVINPLYSKFSSPGRVILDSNAVVSLHKSYGADNPEILSQIFEGTSYNITIPESVVRELRGLSTSQQGSKSGKKATIPKKVLNYFLSRIENDPNFNIEPDINYSDNQIDYLRRKWDNFGETNEGRRLIHGYKKDFDNDLLRVADGKIAVVANEKALNGEHIFVFTDDAALKGVLGEMNKDLAKSNKSQMSYGGFKDWERYYAGYASAAA